jgi:hypothetical protein
MTKLMIEAWNEGKPNKPNECFAMAEKVAPFVHPKLANTTLSGDVDKPLRQVMEIAWLPSALNESESLSPTHQEDSSSPTTNGHNGGHA